MAGGKNDQPSTGNSSRRYFCCAVKSATTPCGAAASGWIQPLTDYEISAVDSIPTPAENGGARKKLKKWVIAQ
jgi:hypothetical protein